MFFSLLLETVCSHLGEIKYSKEIKGFWSCSCRAVLFYFHSSSKEMSSLLVHQRRLDLPYTTFTLKPNSLVVTMTGKVIKLQSILLKNAFRRRKQTNTAKQKKIKGKITICSVCVCVCCLYMNLGPKNNKAVYMRQKWSRPIQNSLKLIVMTSLLKFFYYNNEFVQRLSSVNMTATLYNIQTHQIHWLMQCAVV